MGKRKEVAFEEKVSLVEEYLAGRLRMREAARRAGVGHTTMESWISRYRSEGISALEENGNRSKRKYSEDFKRQVAEEYLSGQGSSMAIAEKYHLRSGNLVLDWVKAYHERNSKRERGGTIMRNDHTIEERLEAVLACLEGGRALQEVAQAHQVAVQTLRSWVKKYQELGPAGLEDRRGKRLADQTPRSRDEALRIENARLKKENELLKMELYLRKKVQELERGDRRGSFGRNSSMKRCATVRKTRDFLWGQPAVHCISPGPAITSGAPGQPGAASPRISASPSWCRRSTGRAQTRDTAAFGTIWTSITIRRSTISGHCASAVALGFSLW